MVRKVLSILGMVMFLAGTAVSGVFAMLAGAGWIIMHTGPYAVSIICDIIVIFCAIGVAAGYEY